MSNPQLPLVTLHTAVRLLTNTYQILFVIPSNLFHQNRFMDISPAPDGVSTKLVASIYVVFTSHWRCVIVFINPNPCNFSPTPLTVFMSHLVTWSLLQPDVLLGAKIAGDHLHFVHYLHYMMVRFGLPTQPLEARRAGYLQEKWMFGPQWLRISPFGQKEKRAC